jgi:hypothetical protein
MTEGEWRTGTDPGALLEFARGRLSDRVARLYAVACCRRVWHLLIDPRSRSAVEQAAETAEGLRMPWSLAAAEEAAETAVIDLSLGTDPEWLAPEQQAILWAAHAAHAAANLWAFTAAINAARFAADALEAVDVSFCHPAFLSPVRRQQCGLVHCLAGDPFHPPTFHPAWRSANAVALARTAYEEDCWDRLPILADALMDAGCEDESLLGHLRGPGPHARGCRAVDLVLGRV